ncbi:MAG: gamma-glutamylcyclotransferase [Anaerolineaceae bacterium]|nr:gamma-glutamylcyclotransferase [Anaerolineaceae bacterium]
MAFINFVVNGTLMRGLSLNQNLLDVTAEFVSDARTAPKYRLWSIRDEYPAMIRDENNGAKIDVEIWKLSAEALVTILQNEPPGLVVGKIELEDGKSMLGVLGETFIVVGQKEITEWNGWRNYLRM